MDLVSRSVARDDSRQSYESVILGNAPCTGHSACDAIIAGNGVVDASPSLCARHGDAQLIHEAAIGKIAGEQLLKLQTPRPDRAGGGSENHRGLFGLINGEREKQMTAVIWRGILIPFLGTALGRGCVFLCSEN